MISVSRSVATICLLACTPVAAGEQDKREQAETTNARNVVIFIADGVGPTFHAAARIYAEQKDGRELVVDSFPQVAMARTSAVDDYVPDSAATATALLAGTWTSNGRVGVDPAFGPEQCSGESPTGLASVAAASGKASGVITDSLLVDATPAAFYGRAGQRGWIIDERVPDQFRAAGCHGLVEQLVGSDLRVAFGGGRVIFAGPEFRDPERDAGGIRRDGVDLFDQWRQKPRAAVVFDRDSLLATDPNGTDRLLGLFAPAAMIEETDRRGNPSLAEMAVAALAILQRDPEGFIMLVETEGTDEYQHEGRIEAAFESYLALDEAVAAVLARVNLDDTLVIVTSDHGQPIAMAGPAARGADILGPSTRKVDGAVRAVEALDGQPYPVLSFTVGPREGADAEASNAAAESSERAREAGPYPARAVPHSGVDVTVFAAGAGAARIGGVIDQAEIYRRILGAIIGTAGEAE